IKFHTDNHIEGRERMETYFSSLIETTLKRFEDNITRLDVYLGDENSDKFGTNDKRCTIEAHMGGKPPLAVVNYSDTIEKAFGGASDKIKRVLDTTFSKMRNH
ncbi:MAG TPA: HPF/RaiA family ribosome-associated protein, partial [Flavobacterium sp.]|nr:HPF/RaiA family ribosome-associated protein [Flavobacterium sp.]